MISLKPIMAHQRFQSPHQPPLNQSHPHPPSFRFSTQPRYIQFLVFVTFPFYGTYRVIKRIVYEVGMKAIDVAEHVVRTSRAVFKVCQHLYSIVAPKIWNGLIFPLIVHPAKRFIVDPVILGIRFVYDCVAAAIVMTYDVTCAVFEAMVNTWNAMF
jgi:hypothetical protein